MAPGTLNLEIRCRLVIWYTPWKCFLSTHWDSSVIPWAGLIDEMKSEYLTSAETESR